MLRNWLRDLRNYLVLSCAALLAAAGVGRAQAPAPADLKEQVEAQQKRIEELEALIRGGRLRPAAAEADDKKADPAPKPLDEAAVKKILADYLKDNPGVGMPSGVQTGLDSGRGFFIRSAPDPKYVNWDDGSKIPFELRIRGRIQADYYFYKTTDVLNHQTGALANPVALTPGRGVRGANSSPDFSQLEIKRMRVIFEGTVFDPNLRYHIQLDGNTRGLAGLAGGGVPGTTGETSVGGVAGGNTEATVDHAMRLFSAYIAYDMHPCGYEKGCGPDCPEGTYRYTPTLTAIVGKFKPFFSFEEVMGSANAQFVDYGMSNWFFDADDDNYLMGAGFQYKNFDDRLYVQGIVTNGDETQTANLQMDDLPGVNIGGWYDFGGSWNEARKKWDLFGDSLSDIDWSCKPVLRVGGAVNLVPMDRHSEFTNAELNRVRVTPGGPGGTSLLGLLNGGGINNNAAGVGQFAADAFDEYTFETFWALHYKGFSLYNDWWFRDVDNFRGRRLPVNAAGGPVYPGNGVDQTILYTSNLGAAVFPVHGLFDYGMQLQAGYFIVPKKLEVAARWSYIRGESGDINGRVGGPVVLLSTAQKTALGIPSPATTAVRVLPTAFQNFHESDEYAVGLNYFFKRHLVKWQTDLSVYQGGNPAAGGQSPAGFIPGVDGWMVRTQVQLAF